MDCCRHMQEAENTASNDSDDAIRCDQGEDDGMMDVDDTEMDEFMADMDWEDD